MGKSDLVPVPDCPTAAALSARDLAAVKLLVDRPKDLALVQLLHATGRIEMETVRSRLDFLDMAVELRLRLMASCKQMRTKGDPGSLTVTIPVEPTFRAM